MREKGRGGWSCRWRERGGRSVVRTWRVGVRQSEHGIAQEGIGSRRERNRTIVGMQAERRRRRVGEKERKRAKIESDRMVEGESRKKRNSSRRRRQRVREREGERDIESQVERAGARTGGWRIEIHGGWCARRVARATANVGVLERGWGESGRRERERWERAVGESGGDSLGRRNQSGPGFRSRRSVHRRVPWRAVGLCGIIRSACFLAKRKRRKRGRESWLKLRDRRIWQETRNDEIVITVLGVIVRSEERRGCSLSREISAPIRRTYLSHRSRETNSYSSFTSTDSVVSYRSRSVDSVISTWRRKSERNFRSVATTDVNKESDARINKSRGASGCLSPTRCWELSALGGRNREARKVSEWQWRKCVIVRTADDRKFLTTRVYITKEDRQDDVHQTWDGLGDISWSIFLSGKFSLWLIKFDESTIEKRNLETQRFHEMFEKYLRD